MIYPIFIIKISTNTLQFDDLFYLFFSVFTHLKTRNHRRDKEKWQKENTLLWHFVSSRVNQLILFRLVKKKTSFFFPFASLVLRISFGEFQHSKCCSNNKIHVMLTPNWRKKTKIVIFFSSYFHMILFFFFLLLLLCVLSLSLDLFTIFDDEEV